MPKQTIYTGSPQSIFAIAKNYEHGRISSETVQLGEELAEESQVILDSAQGAALRRPAQPSTKDTQI